jgi:hypothetical protein
MFHEQYEVDGDIVLFRCSECGYLSLSLGQTHAHIETHRGCSRFNIKLPFTKTAIADTDQLMKYTEIVRVTDTKQTTLEQVEGL